MLLMRILGSTRISAGAALSIVIVGMAVGVSQADAAEVVGKVASNKKSVVSLDGFVETGGELDLTQDPLGDWLEQNADKMRLYVDGQTNTEKPKQFVPPTGTSSTMDPALQVAAVIADLGYNKRCSAFADENGLGRLGKVVVNEISNGQFEHVGNLLNGSDDLKRACPRYDTLNTNEKAHVFVMLLASMSFFESSCDPTSGLKRRVQGPNGALGGLIQLHKGKENVYAPNCPRGASNKPETTLTCGLSMLNKQLDRQEAIFSPRSYWEVLRPKKTFVKTKSGKRRQVQLARTVVGSLRELPLCHN
ncbi:MAG: hypothetical protein JNJ49_02115 [Bdellovibrionaceae bacterium]|nr:hypothetical protein [Pseudobdellovibrionaceae bacterium]